MPLLNLETGTLCFQSHPVDPDAPPVEVCLRAGMPLSMLPPRLFTYQEALVCLPACAVQGGSLAAVCSFEAEQLRTVTLYVADVGGKGNGNTARARALLFSLLHLVDPCPDTRHSVCVRCPFGELLLCGDPHTGQPSLRLSYQNQAH
ncbi:MAG: hypothetical protein RR696_09025 [Clostridia bacterium]